MSIKNNQEKMFGDGQADPGRQNQDQGRKDHHDRQFKTEINAEEIKDRILKLAEWFPPDQFNFASPSRSIAGIPRGHKIIVGVLQLDKAPSDDYHPSEEKDKNGKKILHGYFPSAQAIRKLAALAGVDPLLSEVIEKERNDMGQLMMIKHKVVGGVINFDGSMLTAQATKTIDRGALIDLGYSEYRVKKIMAYAAERAETGAFARVAKHLLGLNNLIQPGMTGKPWIVLKLVLDIDPTDADHKKLLLERQYGHHGFKQLIYGPEPKALPVPDEPQNIDDLVNTEGGPDGEEIPLPEDEMPY